VLVLCAFRYIMNHQPPCRRKLVHLDAEMCAEISNTADGSKCLREPMMSTSVRCSRISRGLLPRPSHKSVKSRSQSFEMPGISEFDCDDVDRSNSDVELTNNNSDIVNDSVQPKCSIDFVSAKQYMNPTFCLLNNPVPQNTVISPKKHGRMLVGNDTRRTRSKRVVTTQKNSLDRYFKPVPSQLCTTEHERTSDCCSMPENSPQKSVLLSPVAKLPGSDNIYYLSPEGKNSTSCDNVSPGHCSSSAASASVPEGLAICASASSLNDDNDDLDFEASFDYIWEKNPGAKRKSAKPRSHSSKKMATCVSQTDRISRKSVDSGCMQNSNILSTEQYGLLGFSDNTLLALDCDTDFEEEDKTDYFSLLPPEVVSNILCRLPFTDLCLNVNRVCLTWKNIIDSDTVSYLRFL